MVKDEPWALEAPGLILGRQPGFAVFKKDEMENAPWECGAFLRGADPRLCRTRSAC